MPFVIPFERRDKYAVLAIFRASCGLLRKPPSTRTAGIIRPARTVNLSLFIPLSSAWVFLITDACIAVARAMFSESLAFPLRKLFLTPLSLWVPDP